MSTLKRPGVDLYYETAGQGPPVLLIQGVGVVGEGWRLQVDALGQRFQTLIFDNRGIGKSTPCTGPVSIETMAEDALALMDAAGWESAHVVGHSMGGVIAQQLALDAPRRVRSLSLLCTFARGKDAARLTPWVLWMTLRTRIGTRRMRRRAFVEMLCPPGALEAVDIDAVARRFGVLIGRDLADQPPILMKQLLAMARHNASARLGELRDIPTLVASAEHDRIALPSYGRTLANAIPGARFELLRDASHGVIIHAPDSINKPLTDFIDAIETARRTANR
jgi:pimeloyl-ACP methyl ester carboxylesterase